MVRNPLRDLLSRLLWDPKMDKGDYEIAYLSRGVEGGVERVSCRKLVKVTKDFFVYIKGGEEKYIPLHRVIEVVDKRRGKIVYSNPRFREA